MIVKNKLSPITQRTRELRKQMTIEEKILWRQLRNRELFPIPFRRQHPIGPYFIDFYCKKIGVVIELDGSQHADKKNLFYDSKRTKFLEAKGLKVIRFWNDEIRNTLPEVIEYLLDIIDQYTTSHSSHVSLDLSSGES